MLTVQINMTTLAIRSKSLFYFGTKSLLSPYLNQLFYGITQMHSLYRPLKTPANSYFRWCC